MGILLCYLFSVNSLVFRQSPPKKKHRPGILRISLTASPTLPNYITYYKPHIYTLYAPQNTHLCNVYAVFSHFMHKPLYFPVYFRYLYTILCIYIHFYLLYPLFYTHSSYNNCIIFTHSTVSFWPWKNLTPYRKRQEQAPLHLSPYREGSTKLNYYII